MSDIYSELSWRGLINQVTDEEHLLRGVLFQARERTLRPLSGHGSLVRPEGLVHPAVIRHVLALSVLAIDLLLN